MKYFIAESVMNDNLPYTQEQIDEQFLPLHVAHLQEGIAAGMLLMGGPSGTGGFLILRAESREELDAFIAKDPFQINHFNRFIIREFTPKDRADMVKDW